MQSSISPVFVSFMFALSGCGGPSSLEECVLDELRGFGGDTRSVKGTAIAVCRQKYPALAAAADERARAASAAKRAAEKAEWKALRERFQLE